MLSLGVWSLEGVLSLGGVILRGCGTKGVWSLGGVVLRG